MNSAPGSKWLTRLSSLPVVCAALVFLVLAITWQLPKDGFSDAWSYHYYSGAMLFHNRLDLDYFGASMQGYFNPLVYAPFAAMVKAGWSDRTISMVMACYSSVALIIMVVFYRVALQQAHWYFLASITLSLLTLLVLVCTGSSISDLFLQIPVFLALLLLFYPQIAVRSQLAGSGLCFGLALGLKLSAIVYAPGFAILLLSRKLRQLLNWRGLLLYTAAVVVGFIIADGWWGTELYRHFGNPFFPFFNQWFHSPDFPAESVSNYRFVLPSLLKQALLPFRISSSDVYTYIELREPDIRPGIFVLSIMGLLVARYLIKRKPLLTEPEADFLSFLFVSLYAWVFISGNGRYGIGILLLIGGGIIVSLRAFLPVKVFRVVVLLVLFLQLFNLDNGGTIGMSSVRFHPIPWQGKWFNIDFSSVLGQGNQLVMTGTNNSYSEMVKDMGEGSALINVHGPFALDNNETIRRKIDQYAGRILGMVLTTPELATNHQWIDKLYFNEFSRFGLAVHDYGRCQFVGPKDADGNVTGGLLFCPLVKDSSVADRYQEIIRKPSDYFAHIETICPDLFSPRKNALTLTEHTVEKYYSNHEVQVYMDSMENIHAKKQWSMMIYPLGDMKEVLSLSPEAWRNKYCAPLEKSRAYTPE